MSDWGRVGSAFEHERYSVKRESLRRGRRKCLQAGGCSNRPTHAGYANGVCLMIGCEFHVAAWVRDPLHYARRQHAEWHRKTFGVAND